MIILILQYVINGGHWVHSSRSPHEADASGNVNNHFTRERPTLPISQGQC